MVNLHESHMIQGLKDDVNILDIKGEAIYLEENDIANRLALLKKIEDFEHIKRLDLMQNAKDKIGPTMAVLRQDIHRNIQRLEKMLESDPKLYLNIVEILKKEASEGTSKKVASSSKAFVWLTRSLDFMVNLLELIEKDIAVDMEKAVEEAYKATLKPWHGWISSTAYRVALKLVPDNKTMIDILISEAEDQETLKQDIQTFAPNWLDLVYYPLTVVSAVFNCLYKIGPTMAVLRQDIHRNIQRLEKMLESDPKLYLNIVEILKKEATEGTSKKVASSSKAFVWLTRSLDFTVNLLELIEKDIAVDMEKAVEEAYKATLKPWHGWISSTAYRVALKLVPDNKTMIDILISEAEDQETLKQDIQTFTSMIVPLLDEIHSILVSFLLILYDHTLMLEESCNFKIQIQIFTSIVFIYSTGNLWAGQAEGNIKNEAETMTIIKIVALKLVPDNKTMIDILISEAEDQETLKQDIQTFASMIVPLLDEIHSILVSFLLILYDHTLMLEESCNFKIQIQIFTSIVFIYSTGNLWAGQAEGNIKNEAETMTIIKIPLASGCMREPEPEVYNSCLLIALMMDEERLSSDGLKYATSNNTPDPKYSPIQTYSQFKT
ncbi:glycolipid transfer protein (GLTP) family protein [Artemisia annua]|uniref:Glycolipid transfer protein (GLTP) family protein n=1 Tax=Artemisia annua TaxID=35608 RepID=A0A2U1QH50_ARTAN|nr:glycolipid transfer protein (GLTP) family protein [Artemisia annua]